MAIQGLTPRAEPPILLDSQPLVAGTGDASVPNKESAKKRIRQDAKRQARNRWRKRIIKNGIKSFLDAIAHKDVPAAEASFKTVQKQLDRISTTSTMHKKKAARSKSRLSRRLRDLKAAG
jgi:small subunit ribosomal protein S20